MKGLTHCFAIPRPFEVVRRLWAKGAKFMETQQVKTEEYAKCIEGSKRIRWDIDKDVLRDANLISPRNSFPMASRRSISWSS